MRIDAVHWDTVPAVMARRFAPWAALLLGVGTALAGSEVPAPFSSLAEQLRHASAAFGIEIRGLEKTRDSAPIPVPMTDARHLTGLLEDFNYLVVHAPDGGIERITILERKKPTLDHLVLTTQKVGERHTIAAFLTGRGGTRIPVQLLVDTGADYLVLPESMLATLGIEPDSLESRTMQTANGRTPAKVGRLPRLELGSDVLEDVDVAFIADERLGDEKILGMQVLSRYRMTIDDEQQRITLIKIK